MERPGYILTREPEVGLELRAIEGESPVRASEKDDCRDPRVPYVGTRAGMWVPETSNPKYVPRPIVY